MSKETGGSAFPTHLNLTQGMTMRDYFAAKAMQGFMANKAYPTTFLPKEDAEWAYAIADAMLKAREQT